MILVGAGRGDKEQFVAYLFVDDDAARACADRYVAEGDGRQAILVDIGNYTLTRITQKPTEKPAETTTP